MTVLLDRDFTAVGAETYPVDLSLDHTIAVQPPPASNGKAAAAPELPAAKSETIKTPVYNPFLLSAIGRMVSKNAGYRVGVVGYRVKQILRRETVDSNGIAIERFKGMRVLYRTESETRGQPTDMYNEYLIGGAFDSGDLGKVALDMLGLEAIEDSNKCGLEHSPDDLPYEYPSQFIG